MPDLRGATHSGGGDRELVVSGQWPVVSKDQSSPAIPRTTDYYPLPTVPLLLFDHVSKWYGPVIGLNQVTLELRPGITGLVGANGAGKSTLLRLAAGQLRPDLGRVEVMGEDAWSSRARMLMGYCPEVDAFYEEMSGRQFVYTMAR